MHKVMYMKDPAPEAPHLICRMTDWLEVASQNPADFQTSRTKIRKKKHPWCTTQKTLTSHSSYASMATHPAKAILWHQHSIDIQVIFFSPKMLFFKVD